jgi:hypothetical protein
MLRRAQANTDNQHRKPTRADTQVLRRGRTIPAALRQYYVGSLYNKCLSDAHGWQKNYAKTKWFFGWHG